MEAVIGNQADSRLVHRVSAPSKIELITIFLTPLIFLVEKEVAPGLPLFIPQHLYFFFSLAILPIALHGALRRQARVSPWFFVLLVVVLLNHIATSVIYGASYLTEIIPSFFRLCYVYYVMWLVKLMMATQKSFDAYVHGLTIAFRVVFVVYLLQMATVLGFDPARELNNLLAPIYEARWPPHELMKDSVHLYYMDGSYAATTERINGFSKEASTFVAGVSLLFLPIFIPLAARKIGNHSQRRYLIYSLLVVVMMMTAKASSGLVIGAVAFFMLMVARQKKISMKYATVALFVFAFICAMPFIVQSDKISKLADMTNVSTQTRAATVIAGFDTLMDQPVLGRGDTFYKFVYENIPWWADNRELDSYFTEDSLHVFCLPISFYGEFGLFAFGLFAFFLWKIFRSTFVSANHAVFSKISIRVFLVLLLLNGMSLATYMHPFLFLSLGVAYALYKNRRLA